MALSHTDEVAHLHLQLGGTLIMILDTAQRVRGVRLSFQGPRLAGKKLWLLWINYIFDCNWGINAGMTRRIATFCVITVDIHIHKSSVVK